MKQGRGSAKIAQGGALRCFGIYGYVVIIINNSLTLDTELKLTDENRVKIKFVKFFLKNIFHKFFGKPAGEC